MNIYIDTIDRQAKQIAEYQAEIERLKGEPKAAPESVSAWQVQLAHEAVEDWDGQDDADLSDLLSQKLGRDFAAKAEIDRLRAELAETHLELKNALLACASAEEANRRYREEHVRLSGEKEALKEALAEEVAQGDLMTKQLRDALAKTAPPASRAPNPFTF